MTVQVTRGPEEVPRRRREPERVEAPAEAPTVLEGEIVSEEDMPPLETLVDLSGVTALAMTNPLHAIEEETRASRRHVDRLLRALETIADDPPEFEHFIDPDLTRAYNRLDEKGIYHLDAGKGRFVNLQNAVETETSWWGLSRKETATVTITTDLREEYSFSYVIPKDGKPLSEGIMTNIASKLRRIVRGQQYTPEQEARFVTGVASFIGSPDVSEKYLARRHEEMGEQTSEELQRYLASVRERLDGIWQAVERRMYALRDTLTDEGIQQLVAEERDAALEALHHERVRLLGVLDTSMLEHAEGVKAEVEAEIAQAWDAFEVERKQKEEAAKRSLAARKGALTRRENEMQETFDAMYAEKDAELAAREIVIEARERLVKRDYAKVGKLKAEWELKLAGHREAIDANRDFIYMKLTEIFPKNRVWGKDSMTPDVHMELTDLIVRVLGKSRHINVAQGMEAIEHLRNAVYRKEERMGKSHAMALAAGLYGLVEYIDGYKVSVPDIIERLYDKAESVGGRARVKVREALVAASLGDFAYKESTYKKKLARLAEK